MINKKKIPEATYIEPEDEAFENNPLINGLPPSMDESDVVKLLYRMPKVKAEDKNLPRKHRRYRIFSILTGFRYVTNQHIKLEENIAMILRYGYVERNIADKEYEDLINNTNFEELVKITPTTCSIFSSSVIGFSGAGKSDALKHILASYRQAQTHPEYGGHIQLVWLKIDAPHDGSAKSLCAHFFDAVDNVLGTSYKRQYFKVHLSADSMLPNIARVAAIHSLGLFVIDELQHLKAAKSGGYKKILNFFVTMTNVIKVPVLMVGTPSSMTMFDYELRSARRLCQIGNIEWNPFSREKGSWDKFLNKMWKLQWIKIETPLTEGLNDYFWNCCQGLPSIATILYFLCQMRAVATKKETITLQLVLDVYNEELRPIHPMIKALRSGRTEEILKFEDLSLNDMIKEIQHNYTDTDIDPDEFEVLSEEDNDKERDLIDFLIKSGIPEEFAKIEARQAISNHPEANLMTLVSNILTGAEEDKQPSKKPKSKTQKSTKLQPRYIENDLRKIADSGAPYEDLKTAGCICESDSFL